MESINALSFVEQEEASPNMAGITVATLEERVKIHVLYFRLAIGGLVVWLGWLTLMLFNMNRDIGKIGIAQANSTANIVASLLNQSPPTQQDAAANLNAATTLLKNAKIGDQKPTVEALKSVSLAIGHAQAKYSDLPELWKTTAQFINYKSKAVLPPSAEKRVSEARSLYCKNISTAPLIVFNGCTFDLEGISISSGQPILFVNSIIRYSGGRISLQAPSVQFLNCLFEFDIPRVPSSEGKRMMERLVSTSTPEINVPLS
jgi:hypothetical protein